MTVTCCSRTPFVRRVILAASFGGVTDTLVGSVGDRQDGQAYRLKVERENRLGNPGLVAPDADRM